MKIPVHNSQAQLTKQSSSVIQDPATFAQKGRNLQALGEGFSKLGDRVQKIDDVNRKVAAANNLDDEMTATEIELSKNANLTEPDITAAVQKLSGTLNSNANSLGSQSDRASLSSASHKAINNLEIKYRGEMLKQAGYRAIAGDKDLQDRILMKIGSRQDPTALIEEREKALKKHFTAGVYNAKTYQENKSGFKQKVLDATITRDIQDDPRGAIQNINNGYYGDELLDPAKYIREAKTQQSTNALIAKNEKTNAFRNDTKNVMDQVSAEGLNSFTAGSFEGKALTDPASAGFYDALQVAYDDPEIRAGNAVTDDYIFNDLSAKASNPKFSQTLLRTLVAKNLGNLSPEDVSKILPQAEVAEEPEETTRRQELEAGMKKITQWVKNYHSGSQEMLKEMTSNFVLQSQTPMKAADEAIRHFMLKDHPELSKFSANDMPTTVMEAEGGFNRIYDQQKEEGKKGVEKGEEEENAE